jgi:hypothetical protein
MESTFARLQSARCTLAALPVLRRVMQPSRPHLDPDRLVGIVCAASAAVALLVA